MNFHQNNDFFIKKKMNYHRNGINVHPYDVQATYVNVHQNTIFFVKIMSFHQADDFSSECEKCSS